jgi:hypothetical protein
MEAVMEGNEKQNIEQSELDYINAKRTYDAYQDLELQAARAAQRAIEDVHGLTMQVMQNAIESANMVGKQAIRHSDIAIDRQWNIDEVAQLVANTSTFKDVIAAAVAAAFASSVATP